MSKESIYRLDPEYKLVYSVLQFLKNDLYDPETANSPYVQGAIPELEELKKLMEDRLEAQIESDQ